jgi:hypothetical protein
MFVATLLALTMTIGCSRAVDTAARFDTQVEQSWTKDANWGNAIALLSTGGNFVDSGEPGEQLLDVPHVLPLLKRLNAEFGLQWEAITEAKNPTRALAVVAQLPADPSAQLKIRQAIEREQNDFPGAILHQWGHRWLSVNFLTKEQFEFLEKGMKS